MDGRKKGTGRAPHTKPEELGEVTNSEADRYHIVQSEMNTF